MKVKFEEINEEKICTKNEVREKIKDIAKQVELIIILGNKSNASTNCLHEIAVKECRNAMIIGTKEDIYTNYIKRFKVVGIISNSKIPKNEAKDIVNIIKKLKTEGYMYENSR